MQPPRQSVLWSRLRSPAAAAAAALLLTGFSAVLGQILLMREMVAVFNGNEISLGITLAAWLLWTAAGSLLCGVAGPRMASARRMVAGLELLLGVSLLPTLWALRLSRSLFETVPGEVLGPLPVLLASLACLSFFCLLSGALFVAAARLLGQALAVEADSAGSAAYLLEAAGSALGGLVASLLLLGALSAFRIAILVLLLNLSMAAVLWFGSRRNRLLAAALLLPAACLLFPAAPSWEAAAQARLWPGFRLLASRDSIYGHLAVREAGGVRSLYQNGVLLASSPDQAAAEESVHYALLEHPAPRRVLLIGGGVNGSIAQALRHPTVERIDSVELDPALIGVARAFFPAESAAAFADPRVHLHLGDGRFYLRGTRDTFDVIAVNLPDPQTAQLNRFYTAEFFRSARDHLAPGGVFSFDLRSSEESVSPALAEFLRCIQRTLAEVFPATVAIPGETIHFFAALRPGVLTADPGTLVSRLLQRRLNTRYVREYFIPFRMTPDRMEQAAAQLQPLPATPVNRDFEPIAYYFNVVLWSAQFNPAYARSLQAAGRVDFAAALAALLVTLLALALLGSLLPSRQGRARRAAAWSMASTGFTLMALQIFLLLAFQSIYGYVYHQLAILIALGMAGIACGSWLGRRRAHPGGAAACRRLAATQLLLALSAPALMLLVSLLAKLSGAASAWMGAQCVFPALAALAGVLGGYQFPIATEVYFNGRRARSGLGTLYAVDLLGGCAGALVLSGYLIPVFGFWRTAWLTTAVSLPPALLAALAGAPVPESEGPEPPSS